MPQKSSRNRGVWSIFAVLLIGAVLRFPLANRDEHFQVDEALYASIARQVALQGDLYLINTVIDKPPLLFWTIGGSFGLFGPSEFATRLPNIAASMITLASVYSLAKRLYPDRRIALMTTLMLAVSPFDRALAATAFTDPMLTMFVVSGCALAVRGRWRLAGLLLALAFATKPSALQWIPLVIALGGTQYSRWQRVLLGVLNMTLGFVVCFIPLIIWSATRAVIPDFWTLNLYNNNPGRFIRAEEFLPRLTLWLGWLNTIVPLPMIGWLSAPIQMARREVTTGPKIISRAIAIDIILTSYTLGSLALWWLVAFPVYDRYLHTLAPLLLLLCARVLMAVWNQFRLPFIALLILVSCSPLLTVQMRVGGDPTEVAGINDLAATLNKLPINTAVYNHSLGWELGYYLGPKPPIHLIWEATADDLIAAIKLQPGYWLAPRQESDNWLYLLQAAGVKTVGKPLYADKRFVLLYLTL